MFLLLITNSDKERYPHIPSRLSQLIETTHQEQTVTIIWYSSSIVLWSPAVLMPTRHQHHLEPVMSFGAMLPPLNRPSINHLLSSRCLFSHPQGRHRHRHWRSSRPSWLRHWEPRKVWKLQQRHRSSHCKSPRCLINRRSWQPCHRLVVYSFYNYNTIPSITL